MRCGSNSRPPRFLQPLHAVPGPAVGGRVVERVAVAVQDVGVSVPIEVDEGDPARAVIRVRRAPEQLRPGLHAGEGPDLLPFLADQGQDVERVVGVEVGDDGVDGAGEPLQDMGLELPSAPVLEPQRLAVVVAEGGDRDVEVAVTVEIAGPRVGGPGDSLRHDVAREALVPVVLDDHDRADAQVAGEELSQARDQQVEVAVAVEIRRLHVGRRPDVLGDGMFDVGPRRELADPGDPVPDRVGGQDVGEAVGVEVDDGDVGDLRALVVIPRIADRLRGEQVRRRSVGEDGAALFGRTPAVGRRTARARQSAQQTGLQAPDDGRPDDRSRPGSTA